MYIVDTEPKRGELLHSGKANDVYATDNEDILEIEASDRISAGDGERKSIVEGKGRINNQISMAIFTKLESMGIPTHYIGPGTTDASKFVWKAEPILLEVIGRHYAMGSFVKRYGVNKMNGFYPPFVEYTYKNDEAHDPPIDRETIIALDILTRREIGYIDYLTEQIAVILSDFFDECGGLLIDFKIEFGRLPNGAIIVIDEISPDTCRIIDKETGGSLDKDVFRKNLGDVAATYAKIGEKVMNRGEQKPKPCNPSSIPCDRDGE